MDVGVEETWEEEFASAVDLDKSIGAGIQRCDDTVV